MDHGMSGEKLIYVIRQGQRWRFVVRDADTLYQGSPPRYNSADEALEAAQAAWPEARPVTSE
jgi:hypothetical protein